MILLVVAKTWPGPTFFGPKKKTKTRPESYTLVGLNFFTCVYKYMNK